MAVTTVIEVQCAACGVTLEIPVKNARVSGESLVLSLDIEPCEGCLQRSRDRGEEDGKEIGYSAGYDQGKEDGRTKVYERIDGE